MPWSAHVRPSKHCCPSIQKRHVHVVQNKQHGLAGHQTHLKDSSIVKSQGHKRVWGQKVRAKAPLEACRSKAVLVGNPRHGWTATHFKVDGLRLRVKATLWQSTPNLPGRDILFGPPNA